MKYKETEMKILKICAHFYTKLYSSTLQDQHRSQKNTSPDSLEVKKTLKEMKNSKAQA